MFNFDSISEGKSKEDHSKSNTTWPYEKKNLMSYSLN